MDNALGNTTQDETPERPVTPAAHHYEVGPDLFTKVEDRAHRGTHY